MKADSHIILLPEVVHGFALRNRKWAKSKLTSTQRGCRIHPDMTLVFLELALIQEIQYEAGCKDLVLPKGHRKMVRAVVENHATGSYYMVSQVLERLRPLNASLLLQTVIFSQSPAVRPNCFYMSLICNPGDIGYEPESIEGHLQKHFNLAHKWGGVMLLDEADIFLATRSLRDLSPSLNDLDLTISRDDLKRNGSVSKSWSTTQEFSS